MESSLVVIGVNFRTAPLEVRERYWISEARVAEALHQLSRMDGIEEAVVLSTCARTEFILWTSDFSTAANSVLGFLNRAYGLRLCEWKHFYRLLGEQALLQVFRVASSLDSMIVGNGEIERELTAALARARETGAAGRFLNTILDKALVVARRVRAEILAGSHPALSLPGAGVALAREVLGSLEGRKVLVLGAGRMAELAARHLVSSGAVTVQVASRTYEHAQAVAQQIGAEAARFEERVRALQEADLVISCTGCPHVIITREEAERIAQQRNGRPLCLLDLAVPRDIDPEVRQVPGIFLYDMEDVKEFAARNRAGAHPAIAEAERTVAAEAAAFQKEVASERVGPTILALHERLDELGREELERYSEEFGPLSDPQREALQIFRNRMVHRIAGSLARELKELPETPEQGRLTRAVRRLFHLERSDAATTVRH